MKTKTIKAKPITDHVLTETLYVKPCLGGYGLCGTSFTLDRLRAANKAEGQPLAFAPDKQTLIAEIERLKAIGSANAEAVRHERPEMRPYLDPHVKASEIRALPAGPAVKAFA